MVTISSDTPTAGYSPALVAPDVANNAVTVQFKEFGIRLNFIPQVQPDGVIRLKVSPEVSALDFANGLTISGFTVPALTSRKATTEVDLRDGQSFAIAGLMDNRLVEVANRIPVLSTIPILGNLFKSTDKSKVQTELMVFLTPQVVHDDAEARKIREQQTKELSPDSKKGVKGRIVEPPVNQNGEGAGASEAPRSQVKPPAKPPTKPPTGN